MDEYVYQQGLWVRDYESLETLAPTVRWFGDRDEDARALVAMKIAHRGTQPVTWQFLQEGDSVVLHGPGEPDEEEYGIVFWDGIESIWGGVSIVKVHFGPDPEVPFDPDPKVFFISAGDQIHLYSLASEVR